MLTLEAVLKEKVRRESLRRDARTSLMGFTQYTKPDYECNWHHRVIADALDEWAFTDNCPFLLITAPPRHGKSELVSRRAPAYIFGRDPRANIIAASHTADLANAMSLDVQQIMDSPQYQEIFPNSRLWQPGLELGGRKKRTLKEWHLLGGSAAGVYLCNGVRGALTGRGGDYLFLDDPFKDMEQALSEQYREAVWTWFWSTFWTRRSPGAKVCVTATRWHHDDIHGRLQDTNRDDAPEEVNWRVIHLEAERTEDKPGDEKPYDVRQPGEYLWPTRYGEKELAPIKRLVRIWVALYQGRPTPDEGNVVKRAWIRYYSSLPEDDFEQLLLSVDCAFKDTKSSSRVCLSIYGKRRPPNQAMVYLLDQICDHLGFMATLAAIRTLVARWPELAMATKLVEDKANGTAVIETLKTEIPGIVPYTPKESKYARAISCEPLYQAGNMLYPDPTYLIRGVYPAEWINDHVEEVVGFPFAKFNDRVDCETQALNHLIGGAFMLMLTRADVDEDEPEQTNVLPVGRAVNQKKVNGHLGPDPAFFEALRLTDSSWESYDD